MAVKKLRGDAAAVAGRTVAIAPPVPCPIRPVREATDTMRAHLQASLVAGAVAILLNTALLKLADPIALPTAHAGLLRLITPWVAADEVQRRCLRLATHRRTVHECALFQVGFHLAVGMAMAVFYAFAVEPLLRGPATVKGLIYAAAVCLLNAAAVLPVAMAIRASR